MADEQIEIDEALTVTFSAADPQLPVTITVVRTTGERLELRLSQRALASLEIQLDGFRKAAAAMLQDKPH